MLRSAHPVWIGAQWALAAWLVVVIAAHLGLAGQGWWADEYLDIGLMRGSGWRFLASRVFGFAPRPISETLFMLYGDSVIATGRPLITSFLLLLYGSCALALLLACLRCRTRGLGLTLLGLIAVWMCGGHLNELLFWPAGALAYLPTLTAILVLFMVAQAPGEHPWLTLAALLTAAGSSEVGATFVLLFALASIAAHRGLGGPRASAILLIPSLLALAVMLRLATDRFTTPELIGFGDPTLRNAPLRDLIAACQTLFTEFVVPAADPLPSPLAGRLAWLLGAALTLPRSTRRGGNAALAAACLGAALLSLVGAYGHFGGVCCDRHVGIRALLVLTTLLPLLALLLPRPRPPILAALLVATGVLIVSAPRIAPVLAQYHLYGHAVASRAALWASGASPGPAMRMLTPVDGPLIHPLPLAPGRTVYDGSFAIGTFVLGFFHKQTLDVVDSGQ